MVTALFNVKRGDFCSLCGHEAEQRYVLNLTAGIKARLEKKPTRTDVGVCQYCWSAIAEAITDGLRGATE